MRLPSSPLRARLHHLYNGTGADCRRFRYGVLTLDLATIIFVVATSFVARSPLIGGVDVLIGLVLAVEFAARLIASRRPWREALRLASLADILAIVSFLAPLAGEGLGFMRVMRTLRLLHSYRMLGMLRDDIAFFRRNEEAILAATHLGVFIFVMTAVVYETQHAHNPHIAHYADALYFTVTALTTTGFGDITLPGTAGRLISVVIMLAGVTLFLRLAQALFRPKKVRFTCASCGLQRHEPDAVHCKACGALLNIPDEGLD